jgi:hypothetical protein
MTREQEYLRDINQLKDETISNFEAFLVFAKELLASASFRHYVKAKTIICYNTFSALYQRADAVLALTRVNQGTTANIIVRSMWETLAEYDFINLETTNLNLEIRLASESKQQLSNWSHIQSLRATHPNAETWQATISDEKIASTIIRRQDELQRFSQKHSTINLNTYQSLLSRLEKIDNSRLSRDPDFKTLTQFDYRTVYSLLSGDTHSTVLGNAGNSRRQPKVSLEVRLDAPIYETVRAAHVAYKFLLKFLQDFNRNQNLNKGAELKVFRATDKAHDKRYAELQDIYNF